MCREALTRHASARLQQRAIPEFVVETLLDYGWEQRGRGASRFCFNKRAHRRMDFQAGLRERVERWRNVYVVVADDGAIITAGYRTRRFFGKRKRR